MSKKEGFTALDKEVFESRSVQHVLFCNFIHPKYKSLVTLGSTHLEVYNLVNDDDNNIKFDHFLNLNFNQEVIDAVYVRYYGDTLDSLLVSFEEEKVAILAFDPFSHEVKTISLHFYEFERFKNSRSTFSRPPMLRVDPEQRCAVVLVYDMNLGVIPFRRSPDIISTSMEANNSRRKTGKITSLSFPAKNITQHDLFCNHGVRSTDRPSPNLQTYVTSLCNLTGVKIGYILDMQFLHGYYEPTLMILYDPIGTFVGQALARKDTCCMITLSLNLQKRTNPIIWHMQNLPYDCYKLVPVPRPIGGIVIISPNIIIYLNQSQPSCGFALNGFAKQVTNFPLRHINMFRPLIIDDCVCKFINSEQMIIVNSSGELFVTTLILEPVMRTVVGIRIEKSFKTVIPTTLAVLSSNLLFIGSHVTDSVLLKYSLKDGVGDVYITSDTPESDSSTVTVRAEVSNKLSRSYNWHKLDCLANLGPIRYLSVSENSGYQYLQQQHEGGIDAHHLRLTQELTFTELMAITGLGQYGCVSLINFTVKPQLHSMFEMSPDVMDMWWVQSGSPSSIGTSAAAAADSPATQQTSANGVYVPEDCQTMLDKMEDDVCDQEEDQNAKQQRTYMVLSKSKSTMVLEIGQDTEELQYSGFKADEATVAVGNASSVNYAKADKVYPLTYQVTQTTVRLLNGSQLLDQYKLEAPPGSGGISPIVQVGCSEHYLLMRCADHKLHLIQLPSKPVELATLQPHGLINHVNPIPTSSGRPIASLCLYHDSTGWLYKALLEVETEPENEENGESSDEEDDSRTACGEYSDDIEMLLFGSSSKHLGRNKTVVIDDDNAMDLDPPIIPDSSEEIEKHIYGDNSLDEPILQCQLPEDIIVPSEDCLINPSTKIDETLSGSWAFILYLDGVLEIYSVPDFQLFFRTVNLFDMPNLMLNCLKVPELAHLQASYNNFQNPVKVEKTFEIIVRNIGRNKDRPILFVRDTDELVMYELLAPVPRRARYAAALGDHLRMKKMPHPCLLRCVKKPKEEPRLMELHKQHVSRPNLFRPFENISGFRGLFLAGSYPLWLFFSKDGHINSLPMYMEGVVPCLAGNPSPSINGAEFSYFTTRGELKMMNLPPGYDFEYQKPVKRIALNKNVEFVQYHIESKTFAVISSSEKEVQTIFRLNAENSKEEEKVERDNDIIRAPLQEYCLELFANNLYGSWEAVPHAKIIFEQWDKVTCMATVQLNTNASYGGGTRDLLAIGSNMIHGEEIPVRGKILLADVADVVPQPGRPLTRHKLKVLYDQEQKGPVTALTSCRGYLVSALGQKIYIWQLRDGDLVGIAFVDSVELYVHQLHCIRDLLLAGDLRKSVQLLRFQPQLRVLSLVARDSTGAAKETSAANFLVEGEKLGFVMTERQHGNLVVYCYDPNDSRSRNGRQLIRCADVRLPVPVHCSIRINDRVRDPLVYSASATLALGQELHRQSIYFGSISGSIYRVNAVSQLQMTELSLTEKNLSQSLYHYAGLHPKTCRQYKFAKPELSNAQANVADGNLLYRYVSLPHSHKVEIATKAGIDTNTIMDHLIELYASTLHF